MGFGEKLLVDAMLRCANIRSVGWAAMVVDALNEHAVKFYERYHFQRFAEGSDRLFIPRKTIDQLL